MSIARGPVPARWNFVRDAHSASNKHGSKSESSEARNLTTCNGYFCPEVCAKQRLLSFAKCEIFLEQARAIREGEHEKTSPQLASRGVHHDPERSDRNFGEGGLSSQYEEVGADVIAEGSGSLDLTDLTLTRSGDATSCFGVVAAQGLACVGPLSIPADTYQGFVGPTSFGSGGLHLATSGAGDFTGIVPLVGNLHPPGGYMSGDSLFGEATFAGADFEDLGLTPGRLRLELGRRRARRYVYGPGRRARALDLGALGGGTRRPRTGRPLSPDAKGSGGRLTQKAVARRPRRPANSERTRSTLVNVSMCNMGNGRESITQHSSR